jgi:hypothetical protein
MAMEQRRAQLLFERAHLARHRRLRQPELLARMGEAAGLGGGVKHFQLVPVHSLRPAPVLHLVRSSCHSAASRRSSSASAQEAFGFERRHASDAGGGDRLAIDIVGDVAGREHAGDRGRGRERRDLHIARRLHLELAHHQFGRGEWPIAMNTPSARFCVIAPVLTFFSATPRTFSGLLVAGDVVQHRVPDHLRSSDF